MNANVPAVAPPTLSADRNNAMTTHALAIGLTATLALFAMHHLFGDLAARVHVTIEQAMAEK